MQRRTIAAGAPLALILCGCAFGTRRPELFYPPEGVEHEGALRTAELVVSDAPAGAREAALEAPDVVLAEPADLRTTQKIGEVRNGLGMKTADVVTDTPVPAWIRGALRHELERAGYRVLDGPAQEPGSLSLSVEILTVHSTALFSYEAEVLLFVEAARDGGTLFRNRYAGQGSVGTNWGARGKSYAASLALALRDALTKVVADVEAVQPLAATP